MSFAWLPMIYREIAERAGLDAALGLARARGGQRISVPRNPQLAPWMVEAMGIAGAEAFCDLRGGELVELPTDPVSGKGEKARIRRIRSLINQGLTANQIAAAEGISRRTVFWHRLKVAKNKNSAQFDLFEPSNKA